MKNGVLNFNLKQNELKMFLYLEIKKFAFKVIYLLSTVAMQLELTILIKIVRGIGFLENVIICFLNICSRSYLFHFNIAKFWLDRFLNVS